MTEYENYSLEEIRAFLTVCFSQAATVTYLGPDHKPAVLVRLDGNLYEMTGVKP